MNESVRVVNTAVKREVIQGTLTLSMVVTLPAYNLGKTRSKGITLATFHCVTIDEAHELKSKFLRSNDELVPDFITAKWEYREYL